MLQRTMCIPTNMGKRRGGTRHFGAGDGGNSTQTISILQAVSQLAASPRRHLSHLRRNLRLPKIRYGLPFCQPPAARCCVIPVALLTRGAIRETQRGSSPKQKGEVEPPVLKTFYRVAARGAESLYSLVVMSGAHARTVVTTTTCAAKKLRNVFFLFGLSP